jgi:hypothetical protein
MLNRRDLLRSAPALLLPPLVSNAATPAGDLVRQENARQGTLEWQLVKTRTETTSKYRCPWIEGYVSHASVRSGDSLSFHVSTNPPAPFEIRIFRMGYYGGLGGRLVQHLGSFHGITQPDPEIGPNRLRECQWTACKTITIPDDWPSGVYVGKLTNLLCGTESYTIFVVRDHRPADLIFQTSDNTWQAYNRWPSQFSLYDDGKETWHWGSGVEVSYRRPYGKYCQILDAPLSIGSGEFFLWEFPFVHWLESLGYDVTYVSNTDTHTGAAEPTRAKGFLSVGHDEYWSLEMYRRIEAAIRAGVGVGFFSGNAVCGKIAFDEPATKFQRVGVFGPPGGTREFKAMSSLTHEPPYANALIGAHSTGPVTGGADWICSLPNHWIYKNTGMNLGDRVPGVIGWEWHGDPAPIAGLEIVASGPTQSAPGTLNGGQYTGTVYYGPQSNVVFNAATCWWADGLSAPPGYVRPRVYTAPQGPDHRIQTITRNVLERLINRFA